jgi:hypothetical protein
MAGDGLSLQTTISQLGNVARTQLKGQQSNQPTSPLSEQLAQSKDLKVNRVKKADKSEKGRIQPDEEKEKEKERKQEARQRARSGQDRESPTGSDGESGGTAPANEHQDEVAVDDVGRLVDTHA